MKKYAPVVMLALTSLANAQTAIRPVTTPNAATLQAAIGLDGADVDRVTEAV